MHCSQNNFRLLSVKCSARSEKGGEREEAGPNMTKVKSRQRRGKFMCAAANPKQLRRDLVAILRMTMAAPEWARSGSSCGQQAAKCTTKGKKMGRHRRR